jgi:hypothetical protein
MDILIKLYRLFGPLSTQIQRYVADSISSPLGCHVPFLLGLEFSSLSGALTCRFAITKATASPESLAIHEGLFISTLISPQLTDILASLAAIATLVLYLHFRR